MTKQTKSRNPKMTKQIKKYKFTKETQQYFGRTLHRIVATRNFGNVKAGSLGGWIETEDNLSHEGNCWVYNDARAFENARVFDNALVFGNAWVYGKARVFGNAQVSDNAWVYGRALVFGNTRVFDNAWVFDNVRAFDNARVFDNSRVCGYAWVSGDVVVKDQPHLTEGNHSGEVNEGTEENLSEEVTKLRQENEELKAKLQRFLNVADSIAR